MKTVDFLVPSYTNKIKEDNALYSWWSYPAGELQVRLTEAGIKAVKDTEQVNIITQGMPNIYLLALLADAINEESEGYTDIYMPYLPYSRADRLFTKGDCHGLQVFSELLRTIASDNIYTLDVHSDQAQKLIWNLTNISPKPLIEQALADVIYKTGSPPAIILPDAGAKRYGYSGNNVFQCEKVRNPETGELSGFKVPNLQAHGFTSALIVDDICDGGGTFLGIAKELNKTRPPNKNYDLYLYTTHGIYSKGFGELLTYFKHLYCSDSFPNKGSKEWLTQYPALPLMMESGK